MNYSHPIFLVSVPYLLLAIWAAPKTWKAKVVPDSMRFICSAIWPPRSQDQIRIVLACAICFFDRLVSYVVLEQTRVLIDYLAVNYQHSSESKKLFDHTWHLLIWIGLSKVLEPSIDALSTWVCRIWQARISSEVFGRLFAENADEINGDHQLHVQKAEVLAEFIKSCIFHVLPQAMDLLFHLLLLSQAIGSASAILIMVLGCFNSLIFSNINTGEWFDGLSDTSRQAKYNHQQVVKQCIQNWSIIHWFNRHEHEKERFQSTRAAYDDADYSYTSRFMAFSSFINLLLFILELAVVVLTVNEIAQASVSLGSLAVLLQIWPRIFQPVMTIATHVRQLGSIRRFAKEISEFLQKEPLLADTSLNPLVVSNGRVVFENVSFSYNQNEPTLKGISLTTEPGQMIALVGEKMSGKSTMLNLLLGLYKPETGSISIDGQDLRNVSSSSLKGAIGAVFQTKKLFNMSIKDNIKYGRPGATDDEVREACKVAAIHEIIEKLPIKYLTRAEDCKSSLGEGEVERIAIARAIINKPKIFVFDEATSSVDPSTELHIWDGLRNTYSGCTTFIATNSTSTARAADQIIVLDGGSIVEKGTHSELLGLKGKYFDMSMAEDST